MTPGDWSAGVVAVIVAVSGLVVALAQLAVALRSGQKLDSVKTLVNGHSEALQTLASTAYERGQVSGASVAPTTSLGSSAPPAEPRLDKWGNQLR